MNFASFLVGVNSTLNFRENDPKEELEAIIRSELFSPHANNAAADPMF